MNLVHLASGFCVQWVLCTIGIYLGSVDPAVVAGICRLRLSCHDIHATHGLGVLIPYSFPVQRYDEHSTSGQWQANDGELCGLFSFYFFCPAELKKRDCIKNKPNSNHHNITVDLHTAH